MIAIHPVQNIPSVFQYAFFVDVLYAILYPKVIGVLFCRWLLGIIFQVPGKKMCSMGGMRMKPSMLYLSVIL